MPQNNEAHLPPVLWYTFLFFTGAGSTAAEIVGLRLLAPLFGSSLPIWGSAIAVVIGGLAVGYALGGYVAKRHVTEQTVFRIAAIAATLFVWLPLEFYALTWVRFLSFGEWLVPVSIGSLVVAFLTLLPPSIVFGMISPLAIQVDSRRRNQPVGRIAGTIFMLTTIGSLVGILAPAFITIPLVGTKETAWLFAAPVLLLSLGPLIIAHYRPTRLVLALIPAAALPVLPVPTLPTEVYAEETPYQHVTVHEADDKVALIFDGSRATQSLATKGLYTSRYWDYVGALPALIPDQKEIDVLVLGAAASSGERQMKRFWGNDRKLSFTSVEIDAALFEIAERFFDPPERTFVAEDARVFVARGTDQFDIAVVDTFTRELDVPFHLATQQFFRQLDTRVSESGIVMINTISASTDSMWVRSLGRTVKSVWPHVLITHLPESSNNLILASHHPIQIPTDVDSFPASVHPLLPVLQNAKPIRADGILLTDNYAPTEVLGLAALIGK